MLLVRYANNNLKKLHARKNSDILIVPNCTRKNSIKVLIIKLADAICDVTTTDKRQIWFFLSFARIRLTEHTIVFILMSSC